MDKANGKHVQCSNSVEPECIVFVLDEMLISCEQMSNVFDVLTWADTQMKC